MARITLTPKIKSGMNWVRCSISELIIPELKAPDGPNVENRMINLDTVIQFYLQEERTPNKNPNYYCLSFDCVDGKTRRWYFKTKKDLLKTATNLREYINKKSDPD